VASEQPESAESGRWRIEQCRKESGGRNTSIVSDEAGEVSNEQGIVSDDF